jgi:uncharacterized delta-60 repeat protein
MRAIQPVTAEFSTRSCSRIVGRVTACGVGVLAVALAVSGSVGRAGVGTRPPWLPGRVTSTGPAVPGVSDPAVGVDSVGGIVAAGNADGAGVSRLIVLRYRVDGGLDPSFGVNGLSSLRGRLVNTGAVAAYDDGRILVAGRGAAAGADGFAVTRLRQDGSLDSTFGDGGTVVTQIGGNGATALAVEPLSDGGLVVAGWAPLPSGGRAMAIVRYRVDGSLETGFGRGGVVVNSLPVQPHDVSGVVLAVGFDARGRIVFGGQVPLPTPEGETFRYGPFVARYLADGSRDPGFGNDGMTIGQPGPAVEALAVLADGSVLADGMLRSGSSATLTLTRYRPDGRVDTAFGSGGAISLDWLGNLSGGLRPPRLAVSPDGSIAVVVDLGVVVETAGQPGSAIAALARLRPDGSRDPGFGDNGMVRPPFGNPSGLAFLPDGSVVAVGGVPLFRLARYRTDGSRDAAFITDPPIVEASAAHALALEPDGSAVVAGWVVRDGRRVVQLSRFLPGGLYDLQFGQDGSATVAIGAADSEATAVLGVGNGRLIAAGRAGGSAVLLGFTAGGRLDLTFGIGGIVVGPPGPARALATTPDGRILVAGGGFAASRYLPDGSLDRSFGTGGTVAPLFGDALANALAVQPDGRILLSGERDGAFVVARMLANGALDPSFGVAGIAGGPQGTANSLALQPDGRIVAAGSGFTVVRYATNGLLDKTFGVGGVATPPVAVGDAATVVVQPDGKVVVGGWSRGRHTSVRGFTVARLDPFGYIDETFGPVGEHGVVTTDIGDPAGIEALALGTDEIVAAGTASRQGLPGLAIARYVESGDLALHDGTPLSAVTGSRSRRLTSIGTSYPALSPNGRSIAFVSITGSHPELYVIPTRGGKSRRLTNSPFGKESVALGHISWSPDGRRIAFDATGHVPDPRCLRACVTNDVYIIAADGSNLRRLVSGGSNASWSHDGKYLAYIDAAATNGYGPIMIAKADGSSPRRIAIGTAPLWSPGSDILALQTVGEAAGIVVRRADGRQVRTFAGVGEPTWSPDGRSLAALTGYADKVVVFRLDGGPSRTLMGGYALKAPSWSPDGKTIALFGTRDNQWALIIRSASTGHLLRRVYGYRCEARPMWSPNSTTIYVGG